MFEQAIRFQAQSQPQAVAFETPQGSISFGTFEDAIGQCAQALAAQGLVAGQTVLVADSRPFVHWSLLFALDRLGCISVSGDTTGQALAVAQPDLVLSEQSAGVTGLRCIETDATWLQAAFSAPLVPPIKRSPRPDDIVRIILTSGTTGLPKPIALTRAIIDMRISHMLSSYVPVRTRMLSTMGINSVGGYLASQAVWLGGGSMVYAQGNDIAQSVMALKPSFLLMAPIQLQKLLQDLPADLERRDALRIAVGGSAIAQRLIRTTLSRLTTDLIVAYGSTEAGPTTATSARRVLDQPGAVGHVLPWAELEVIDDAGAVVPPGTIGSLRIRADDMVTGYADGSVDPGLRDGWFYPGDLGHVRPDGMLVLHGRSDDVLNLGGVKTSAFALEELISDVQGVAEAAVFILDNGVDLPRLAAAIVLEAGADLASVGAALSPRLTQPLHCIPVDLIPRNAMGKIDRQNLTKAYRTQPNTGE